MLALGSQLGRIFLFDLLGRLVGRLLGNQRAQLSDQTTLDVLFDLTGRCEAGVHHTAQRPVQIDGTIKLSLKTK